MRTGLTVLVVSLLTTRLAPASGALAVGAALTGALTAFLLLAVQRRRHRRRDDTLRTTGTLGPALVAASALTAVTVLVALAALVLVLAPAVQG